MSSKGQQKGLDGLPGVDSYDATIQQNFLCYNSTGLSVVTKIVHQCYSQVVFIILFAKFVVYNPDNAYSTDSSYPEAIESLGVYPSKD